MARVKVVLNVARLARWLSSAAGFATALLVLALYDEDWKVGVAVAAAVPAVVLFLFSTALAEAAALPARLRNAPSDWPRSMSGSRLLSTDPWRWWSSSCVCVPVLTATSAW